MRKLIILLIVAAVAAGAGWYYGQTSGSSGLEQTPLAGLFPSSAEPEPVDGAPPVKRTGDSVRIASFNIQVFGTSKASKSHVMEILARIVRRFDIVAIQEIRTQDESLLPQFVDLVNKTGRDYDYVIGPRLGRTSSKEQYAFIFDRASVELDRTQVYTIDDPDDMLHREPLVAWFRVRGPSADQAFTFTLVNIHTDPDETDQELDVLADVFRAVRDDGRNEDDVILLGDLNVDDRHMGRLGQLPGITWAISGVPTNTRGTAQYDNVVFHQRATREFNGRSGVFDFLREFNLTIQEALEVSDHLPVWAEFSIYEGGVAGRVSSIGRPSAR